MTVIRSRRSAILTGTNWLPSRFQINDQVKVATTLSIGYLNATVVGVHFSESTVSYDLSIPGFGTVTRIASGDVEPR